MSGPYGRQEMHDDPGSSPEAYLQLLDRRRPTPQMKDVVLPCCDLRWQLFSTMADHPDEEWTAESLASCLRSGSVDDHEAVGAGIDAIHDRMTELMGDQGVEPVPFQRLLTVRLTAAGLAQVRRLLAAWRDDTKAGGSGA
jgi:hypothetical protein